MLTIGDAKQPPRVSEVTDLLIRAEENVVVCILAVPLADRPSYFKKLISAINELRRATGHPHFIVIDEAII